MVKAWMSAVVVRLAWTLPPPPVKVSFVKVLAETVKVPAPVKAARSAAEVKVVGPLVWEVVEKFGNGALAPAPRLVYIIDTDGAKEGKVKPLGREPFVRLPPPGLLIHSPC